MCTATEFDRIERDPDAADGHSRHHHQPRKERNAQTPLLNSAHPAATSGASAPLRRALTVSTHERFWEQVIKNGMYQRSVTINVTVNPPPDITLSRDTTICPEPDRDADREHERGTYPVGAPVRWSNSILVSRAGTYSVAVYRDYCVVRESVESGRTRPNMTFDLGPDRIMCPGGNIIIDARNPDAATYAGTTET